MHDQNEVMTTRKPSTTFQEKQIEVDKGLLIKSVSPDL